VTLNICPKKIRPKWSFVVSIPGADVEGEEDGKERSHHSRVHVELSNLGTNVIIFNFFTNKTTAKNWRFWQKNTT
jgi:hypothetical protein